ncbi:CLUMA_CG012745, isoform A [Clunio marinus]|uniref:CLUMA_CG012745, isoform A n=1 Tax=Clunio marinus TaxID=568069 RepID=A0A1J1IGE3_9DIPT|nr:CLUMA_CG012745, isoform A [Clunio marinus]
MSEDETIMDLNSHENKREVMVYPQAAARNSVFEAIREMKQSGSTSPNFTSITNIIILFTGFYLNV